MKKILPISLMLLASILTAQIATNHKSLTFTWNKSEDFNNVSSYRLWYKTPLEDAYIDYVEVDGSLNLATILNLIPDTEYTAVVTAVNAVGSSDPSNEVAFTTQDFYDVPGSPQNLEIEISVQVTVITNN